MDMVALDLAGPLPETTTGFKYILVMSDYLTRFPEALPLRDTTARTVADAFVSEICFRYGCPGTLLTDQGPQFMSRFFKEVCRLLRVHRISTSPYSPWVNGLVERFNRVLPNVLKHYVDKHNWDEFLGPALFAYRTSIHPATQETPFYAFYGRDAHLPLTRFMEVQPDPYTADVDSYLNGHAVRQIALWQRAKECITAEQAKMVDQYNKKVAPTNFHLGSKVWLLDPVLHADEAKKFQYKFKGPYRIASMTSTNAWLVPLNEPSAKFQEAHLNNLKPFRAAHVPLTLQIPAKTPQTPPALPADPPVVIHDDPPRTPPPQPLPAPVNAPGHHLRTRYVPR